MPSWRAALSLVLLSLAAPVAGAGFESWKIDEVYSNADGSRQYIVLKETQGMNGMNRLAGRSLTASHGGVIKTYTFGIDLPDTATANKRVLIATYGVAATGLVTPDYVMPDRFVATDGGTVNFANVDLFAYGPLPVDGVNAQFAGGAIGANRAINYAGQSASLPAGAITVVEFYNRQLDHYFISPLAPDIDALDTGKFEGWARTGLTFQAQVGFAEFVLPPIGGEGINPVCRFFIPPQHGNSHFFSASPDECAVVLAWIGTNPSFSGYILETPNAFYIALPNTTTGACPVGTVPVYRLWNQRFDSNHRFTIDPVVKAQMVARGYFAEGYGPDTVSMCASSLGQPDPQFRASAVSAFAPGCDNIAATGTLFQNAEVEPMLAVDPSNPANLIGVWQQDRWSDGGSHGLMTGYSSDGGRTWARTAATFSRCAGGNAANGGDYDRASDPWVTFAPDGTAYQISLSFSGAESQPGSSSAILVSRSTDRGRTWSVPVTLIRDGPAAFNDKESITADPTDARFVYATWDRLAGKLGPTWFARTTDGGTTWEPARSIYDPGIDSQTLNNQIIVLPGGTLVNFFTRFDPNPALAIIRSTDKGVTWSAPIVIAQAQALGVRDPENGTDVRDSAGMGSIAVSRQGALVAAWQDARFSGGVRDGIALSRSTDGGLTWFAPVRINRDPTVSAFSPTVTISDDGTIGVTYYDFRNNTTDPSSLPTDLWLAQSSDGVTWRESHVAGPFDLSIAPNAQGLFLGDYHALTSIGPTFVPFYVRTNDGNSGNRTDVFAGLVNSAGTPAKPGTASAVVPDTLTLAEVAPAWTPTADFTRRVQATAKRVLAARLPGLRGISAPPDAD
jgi:hypothetical protein